jgi:hypothetical protein
VAIGHCPLDALCDRCLDDAFGTLKGTAACRGEAWARDVASKVSAARRRQAWPRSSPKAAAIALRKVEDLARDPRLLARLAVELEAWAARAWS